MPDVLDPVAVQQATAMAEAMLPQLRESIDSHMSANVDRMVNARMAELGILDAEGHIARPPADPNPGITQARPFRTMGEQLQVLRAAAQPGGVVDPRQVQLAASIFAATGMSESVGADGGFLLQDTFATEIGQLVHDTGVVWAMIPESHRVPLGGNSNTVKLPAIDETSRANGSRWGGIQAFWTAEAGNFTKSAPQFKRLSMELAKLTVLAYLTDEQMEDTPQVEAVVRAAFAEEFGFKLDDALVNGVGGGMPVGFLNAPCKIKVSKEAGQANGTFVYENALKMWGRAYAKSRPNLVWFINQDVEQQLFQMALVIGTAGVPVYLPANGISGLPYSTLFGRPVMPIEQCPTLGTEGDVILADPTQYWEIDKGGPTFASSIHVAFLTGEQAFRGHIRVDAQPMWTSALVPFKGTNSVSPIITLENR